METIWKSVSELSYVGVWVILAVMVIRCFFFKMPKKFSYILWSIPGIRLLIPISFTGVWGIFRNAAKTSSNSLALQSLPAVKDTVALESQIQRFTGMEFSSIEGGESEAFPSVMTILTIVWLAGLILLAGYGIFSYFRLKRKLKISVKWKENIYLADGIITPFVLIGFPDRIYLPSEIEKEDYHYILLHEQFHIRRKDSLFKLIAYIILCVHWFNPMVWLGVYFFNRDMEMSCDEAVTSALGTEECREYAKDLLRFSISRKQWLQFPVAFGERGVKGRIMNIFRKKAKSKHAYLVAGICVIMAAVILIPNFKDSRVQKAAKEKASYEKDTDNQERQIENGSGGEAGIPSGGEDALENESTDSLLDNESETEVLEKTYSLDENGIESGTAGHTVYIIKKMQITIDEVPVELEWRESQFTKTEMRELAEKVYTGFLAFFQSEGEDEERRYVVNKITYHYSLSEALEKLLSVKGKKMAWQLSVTLPKDWKTDKGMGMLQSKKRQRELNWILVQNEENEWEFLQCAWSDE